MRLSDPVHYFGSDVTHMRSEPWQGQADFNEESLFCQLRMGHEHTCRGHGGPCLTPAVDTEPAPFGHPGPLQGLHPGPLHFFYNFFFFLGLLRSISLTALKSGGCLSTTGVLQKWKFSWREAASLAPFSTGDRGSVCCTCHSPTLLVWGFYVESNTPTPEVIFFFFFEWGVGSGSLLVCFGDYPIRLDWSWAEFQFCRKAWWSCRLLP